MKKLFAFPILMLTVNCSVDKISSPTQPDTISNIPILIPPIQKPPIDQEISRIPSSRWYSGEFILGCEYTYCDGNWITAIVNNYTESNQRIGLAVYRVFNNGTRGLYSHVYAYTSNSLILYRQVPSECQYEVYLGQIDTEFNFRNPPTGNEMYIINTYRNTNFPPCEEVYWQ